jgi:hypothetical protein
MTAPQFQIATSRLSAVRDLPKRDSKVSLARNVRIHACPIFLICLAAVFALTVTLATALLFWLGVTACLPNPA